MQKFRERGSMLLLTKSFFIILVCFSFFPSLSSAVRLSVALDSKPVLKDDTERSFITQHSDNRDQGTAVSKCRLKIIPMATTPISFLLLKPFTASKKAAWISSRAASKFLCFLNPMVFLLAPLSGMMRNFVSSQGSLPYLFPWSSSKRVQTL